MQHVALRRDKRIILEDITLQVPSGEMVGLLGPPGAGKTAVLEVIAGLLAPDSGVVSPAADPRRVGLAPREPALFPDLTVWEHLRFFARLYGLRRPQLQERCEEILVLTGVAGHRDLFSRDCPAGVRQRLNIACALVHRPDLLLLDEPASGADPRTRQDILDLVRQVNDDGVTVVYASHHPADIQALCHRVAIINRGCVAVEGSLSELTRRLVTEEQIRLVLDRPTPLVTENLAALEGVEHCMWDEGTLVMHTRPGQVRLARVIDTASRSGAEVIHAERVRPDLEALFLAYTGRNLRSRDMEHQ